jgi:transketolase
LRETFFRTIETLAEDDKDIVILTGDLGFRLFDSFRARYPARFYDVGVAEANMIGVAAGLALSGKTVYCYSMAPFLVMRAYEHIRIDVAYHNINVILVGVGGGFTYGLEGYTHFSLEDIALMRSLPHMKVIVPADQSETRCLARLSSSHQGPMYIRLGRTGEPQVHANEPDFQIGKAMVLAQGRDVAIFAVGNMVFVAKQVIEKLSTHHISATLINMHTVKPLDMDAVREAAESHRAIFTVEEHNISGGLGSAVAEALAEANYRGVFKRIGVDGLKDVVGNADHLRSVYGLSPEAIYSDILKTVEEA